MAKMTITSDKLEALSPPSLQEFFRDRVREAIARQKVKAPESVEFYLVNLLNGCVKSEDLFGPSSGGYREEPLALLFSRALQSEPAQRIQLLKRLGDLTLYVLGFFPASLSRQLVDSRYYVQMGENAYTNLSGLLSRHPAFSEIYDELARRFVAYVDILAEVSEKSALTLSSGDLLRLYETWLHTGSERAQQLLSDQGIIPVSGTSLKIQ